jgi:endopeptidase La
MTDLDKWFNLFKRSNNDIDYDKTVNDLKFMVLETIEEFFINIKITTKRQIENSLTDLQYIFEETSKIIYDFNDDNEFQLTLKAFTYLFNQFIDDIRDEMMTVSKFNILKYLEELKEDIEPNRAKKVKPMKFSFITDDKHDNINDDEEDEDDEDDEDYNEEYRNKKLTSVNKDIVRKFNTEYKRSKDTNGSDIFDSFQQLPTNKKEKLITKFKELNNYNHSNEPSLFKIISMNTSIEIKKTLLTKWNETIKGFDKSKNMNWFNNAMKIPFGQYKGINLKNIKGSKKINNFLNNLKKDMDNAIYGHDKAKEQVIMMMAQQVRNPDCKGNVFGLWGPPGVGKTCLIKDGIAKAMKKPFVFISLGGATDASFLEGHSYTYEGSIYGRIVQGLMESKCMDPIFYFDELDKVSNTHKGEEIINLLVHLIDPAQNSHFKDKYFYDLDINLSKATFIFSFNEPSRINYILMDRITKIQTKYLTTNQKVIIAQNYLLPLILKDIGLKENSIKLNNELIEHLILKYTYEGGVRKLKQLLYEICRKLNQFNLTKTRINNFIVKFPFTIVQDDFRILLKDYRKINRDKIHTQSAIGMVNGLWANSLGIGGVLPIESQLIPAKDFMAVKATGSLKDVMKESIQVALSVAWNHLPEEKKQYWMNKWKNKPETFHIHCPDGAVSKDGPSAGGAMTTVMYSHLMNVKINNKIAMTGEINLRGQVTAIGGLEEKLTGAKLAGVELALIPEENIEDLEKIKIRCPHLMDNSFKVHLISSFDQILEYCLI